MIKNKNGIYYEQYIKKLNCYNDGYILQSNFKSTDIIINRVSNYVYIYKGNATAIRLGVGTRKIIETYIPSLEVVLVLELFK